MKPLADIPLFTAEQWERDREREENGEILHCPNCDHDEWFHLVLREKRRPNERVCKVCGFCQKADGTPAYRCRLAAHVCLGPRPDDGDCPECGGVVPFPSWHLCVKILLQEEVGEHPCALCGKAQSENHVVPWAAETGDLDLDESEDDDVAAWWKLIDLDRLRALRKRWW